MEDLLRKIGLTEGEIKVYRTLLSLRQSSVGKIIKESSVSSSKVYVILDKLIQKGLVSFIIENNVKKFSPTNPRNILDYVEKQQKELDKIRADSEGLIKKISLELGKYDEESAQIYKGYPGLRVALDNILFELTKSDEYIFFSVSSDEYTEKTKNLFDRVHNIRCERGIRAKGILDTGLKQHTANFKKIRMYDFKFHALNIPTAIIIGKTRVLITIFGESPIGFEIVSLRMVNKYKEYFYALWNSIKN